LKHQHIFLNRIEAADAEIPASDPPQTPAGEAAVSRKRSSECNSCSNTVLTCSSSVAWDAQDGPPGKVAVLRQRPK